MPGDAALCHRVTFVPADPVTWAQAGKPLLPALSGSRAWCGDVKLGFLEQRTSGLPSYCGGSDGFLKLSSDLMKKCFLLFFFSLLLLMLGGRTGGWEDSAGPVSLQSFHAFPFPSLQK